MKKNNYYAIHKNKSPKRLQQRKPNVLAAQLALIQMKSFVQHSIIVSQQFNSIAEKTLAVVDNIKNSAEAFSDLMVKNKRNRYLKQKMIN
jgi:hypothetical protein